MWAGKLLLGRRCGSGCGQFACSLGATSNPRKEIFRWNLEHGRLHQKREYTDSHTKPLLREPHTIVIIYSHPSPARSWTHGQARLVPEVGYSHLPPLCPPASTPFSPAGGP